MNIVSEGVVTRSVRDTAHFYAGAEQFYRNPKLPPVGLVKGPGSRPLRIGLVHDSITGHATDAQTMGHRVEEMPLPVKQSFANDFSIYWGMLSFLVSVFGKRIMSPDFDASKMDNLSQGLASLYKRNMFKTPMVLYRLKKTLNDYALVFKQYDLVLSPVAAHTTPKLGWLSPSQDFDVLFDRLLRYVSFTPLNNASGSPAISLPMGVTTEGLPIAVQFSAAHGDERSLLEISYALEQAHPWRRIQD